ncbi:MAG: RHS repeat-associated core domain-containing protein, partial [Chloroflexi bacterium]|nr:RHS repeat-associated core domain-containing protein [Chloroflexota bacterium]
DASGTVTSNTLYYTHSDHLGSTSAMSDNAGALVSGSTSRFAPFGAFRTEPTADITDRGFTGHKENRDIGLTYMNARYYVVGLNRFSSADTIVPNPANPQSFNRFSYVGNNPLKYIDPSGHCGADTGSDAAQLTSECETLVTELEDAYGIVVYWPGRSGMATNATEHCGEDECTQYHAWTRDEMVALSIAFLMYQEELGSNAMATTFQGVSLVRGDIDHNTSDDIDTAGYYHGGGYFNGFADPTILMLDGASNSNSFFGFFIDDFTWTATHELAHHIDHFATSNGIQNVRNVYGNIPGDSPTSYGGRNNAEGVADSLTVHLWDKHASSWTAPVSILGWSFGEFSLLPGRSHNSLDANRVTFVNDLFGDIQNYASSP